MRIRKNAVFSDCPKDATKVEKQHISVIWKNCCFIDAGEEFGNSIIIRDTENAVFRSEDVAKKQYISRKSWKCCFKEIICNHQRERRKTNGKNKGNLSFETHRNV